MLRENNTRKIAFYAVSKPLLWEAMLAQARDVFGPVCVHRLVTSGTYEERLDQIMRSKAELSSSAVTVGDDWLARYNNEPLFDLFTLRASGRATDARSSRARAARPATPP